MNQRNDWLDISCTASVTFVFVFVAFPLNEVLHGLLLRLNYDPDYSFNLAILSAYLTGFTILATQRLRGEGKISHYLMSKLPGSLDWELAIGLIEILIAIVFSIISILGILMLILIISWFT
ncbi:MAG: hypothetical protein AAB550_03035 [Patescibacteria group bacterium]